MSTPGSLCPMVVQEPSVTNRVTELQLRLPSSQETRDPLPLGLLNELKRPDALLEELENPLETNLRLHSKLLSRLLVHRLETRGIDERMQEVLTHSTRDSMDLELSTAGAEMRLQMTRRLKLLLKDSIVLLESKASAG